MLALQHLLPLTAPLFLLVLIGYALTRWGKWPKPIGDALTQFVFGIAIPALLFRLMSDFSRLPAVDSRLVLAYFGGCLVVYGLGRLLARQLFRLDATAQAVFAMGGIFSNNVLLGLPIAQVTLGEQSLPGVSLVLVFNSLLLWTLVSVSVEWSRHRDFSLPGFAKTAKSVLTNPIVASILLGTAFGFTGLPLPGFVDRTLELIATAALPLSLIALGMGLAEFGVREGWRISVAVSALKLIGQPLVVYVIARLIGLAPLDTAVVVLLAALPVGANVYLMARQFGVLNGPIASATVLTTALGALTTPIVLALAGAPTR